MQRKLKPALTAVLPSAPVHAGWLLHSQQHPWALQFPRKMPLLAMRLSHESHQKAFFVYASLLRKMQSTMQLEIQSRTSQQSFLSAFTVPGLSHAAPCLMLLPHRRDVRVQSPCWKCRLLLCPSVNLSPVTDCEPPAPSVGLLAFKASTLVNELSSTVVYHLQILSTASPAESVCPVHGA